MLKAGSKRRRTQAEMKEQFEQEQLEEIDQRDTQVMLGEKDQEISALRHQLEQAQRDAEKEDYATTVMQGLVEANQLFKAQDGTWQVAG